MNEAGPPASELGINVDTGIQRPPLERLPEQYKKRLGGQEFMPKPDLNFFNKLGETYGFLERGAPTGEARSEFGRESFFTAVSEIKKHAVQLREEDGDVVAVPFDGTADLSTRQGRAALGRYAAAEKARPSTQRMTDLVYLFLHTPQVRSVYNQINAEKMAAAFPGFRTSISPLSSTAFSDLTSYFDVATDQMKGNMNAVVATRDDPRDDDMGLLTGYEEYEYARPESLRKKDYATFGIDFLRAVTEKIVSEAIKKGENIEKKLQKEFLSRGGFAFRLMRVPLRNVYDARGLIRDIETIDLDEARQNIDEGELGLGACPAILKMPLPDGQMSERPIAYEYAATMVNNMPAQLAA